MIAVICNASFPLGVESLMAASAAIAESSATLFWIVEFALASYSFFAAWLPSKSSLSVLLIISPWTLAVHPGTGGGPYPPPNPSIE
ncbi:hypothetical protein D9M71_720650 [compost metagenome]